MKRTAETIIWDLDSTLCDTRHRRHLMPEKHLWGTDEASWDEYSRGCAGDAAIPGALALYRLLEPRYTMTILSARAGLPEVYRATHTWLKDHGIRRYRSLILRPANSPASISPTEWKRERVQYMLDQGTKIHLAIDDHPGSAVMFADLGIPTLVVTPPGLGDLNMAHL